MRWERRFVRGGKDPHEIVINDAMVRGTEEGGTLSITVRMLEDLLKRAGYKEADREQSV